MPEKLDLKAAQSFLDQYAAAVHAIIESVEPAVVRVERHGGENHWRRGRARVNHGSGVVIDAEKGYILTSYHVVSGTQDVTIQFKDGKTVEGKRVGKDPENDLALVKIEAAGLASVPMGDSDALHHGGVLIAVGNPDGNRIVATTGIVSALRQTLRGPSGQLMEGLIQTDAMFNPGMSGGPLLNSQGQIVGLNTASMTEAQGVNLAVPSATIQKILPDLIAHGEIRRPRLGISGEQQRLYEGLTAHHKLEQEEGIYIHEVAEKSPAAQAGVQSGDILITADGQTITGLDALHRVLLAHAFGDEIALRLIRKLDVMTVTAKLTDAE